MDVVVDLSVLDAAKASICLFMGIAIQAANDFFGGQWFVWMRLHGPFTSLSNAIIPSV